MITCSIIAGSATIDLLTAYIQGVSLKLQNSSTSCKDGLRLITIYKPDIVYIDVSFVEQYTAELHLLKSITSFVILSERELTYGDFESLAFDSMFMQPSLPRFLKSIERYGTILYHSFMNVQSIPLVNDPAFEKADHKILKDLGAIHKDVLYIKAIGNYVKVYLDDGTYHLIYTTMINILAVLPKGAFTRIHKSYIVNHDKIISIEGNWVCLINCKEKIPIGKVFRDPFLSTANVKLMKRKKPGNNGINYSSLSLALCILCINVFDLLDFI